MELPKGKGRRRAPVLYQRQEQSDRYMGRKNTKSQFHWSQTQSSSSTRRSKHRQITRIKAARMNMKRRTIRIIAKLLIFSTRFKKRWNRNTWKASPWTIPWPRSPRSWSSNFRKGFASSRMTYLTMISSRVDSIANPVLTSLRRWYSHLWRLRSSTFLGMRPLLGWFIRGQPMRK